MEEAFKVSYEATVQSFHLRQYAAGDSYLARYLLLSHSHEVIITFFSLRKLTFATLQLQIIKVKTGLNQYGYKFDFNEEKKTQPYNYEATIIVWLPHNGPYRSTTVFRGKKLSLLF